MTGKMADPMETMMELPMVGTMAYSMAEKTVSCSCSVLLMAGKTAYLMETTMELLMLMETTMELRRADC